MEITQSAQETRALGARIAAEVKRGSYPRVVCLTGELGSGKTTFVQGFSKELHVSQTRLISPTFIIVRRYELRGESNFLYHMDLYRIRNENDCKSLGLDELFARGTDYIVVEWPERLGVHVPKNRLDVVFSIIDGDKREIRYG